MCSITKLYRDVYWHRYDYNSNNNMRVGGLNRSKPQTDLYVFIRCIVVIKISFYPFLSFFRNKSAITCKK